MLTVYSKNNCPFCTQAKSLLTAKSIAFQEIKIDEDAAAKEYIMSQGHRTVPQIYHNGELFVEGGWQGLSKLSADEIKSRLNITDNPGTL